MLYRAIKVHKGRHEVSVDHRSKTSDFKQASLLFGVNHDGTKAIFPVTSSHAINYL